MANIGTRFETWVETWVDSACDWIDQHDSKPGGYSRAFARIVTRRATGPAIGEPSDMPRWLARSITAASAIVALALAIGTGVTSAALTRTADHIVRTNHLHMVAGHDDHFTGVMIGNPDRAIIIGYAAESGFAIGPGKLD